jgi:hypothetical protein
MGSIGKASYGAGRSVRWLLVGRKTRNGAFSAAPGEGRQERQEGREREQEGAEDDARATSHANTSWFMPSYQRLAAPSCTSTSLSAPSSSAGAQLRALDPMPVLGGVGVVSSILNGIMKLASATSTTDICSRSVLRAAEPDLRGHKRAVDAHHLLVL